jgi:hypothetical protein
MQMNRLPRAARGLRLIGALSLVSLLILAAHPALRRHLSPLPCGFHAITGLPCLFCGGTRALNALVHGDFPSAWYLNPLTFPSAALAALALAVWLTEAATGFRIARWSQRLQPATRWLPILLVPAAAWWGLHIYLALATPKPELADFRNPIAAKARDLIRGTASHSSRSPSQPPDRQLPGK